jgi:hypothetical protein
MNRENPYNRSLENQSMGCPELENGLSEISDDTTYAFSRKNPVKVSGGPANERAYLSMLVGPNKKEITGYFRLGSTGGDETILDMYSLIVEGDTLEKPIYMDMYNCDDPKVPFGFGIKSPD